MKKLSTKSIQSQLILYFTIAILTPAIITSVIGTKLIYNQVINRAENKSITDLNAAREIYRNKISQIEYVTRLTAARSLIVASLLQRNSDTLQQDGSTKDNKEFISRHSGDYAIGLCLNRNSSGSSKTWSLSVCSKAIYIR